jgi:acetyltransferase-like isoleucine patch superfamily enzyme
MLALARSLITAVRLYLMRRRQFNNLKLRRYFKTHHDIDVGLYSYGCFDRWRMPGPIRVGRYCSIAGTVRSAPDNHPTDALTTHPALLERAFGVVDNDLPPAEPLIIEDDVWIGHHVMILPGCKRIGRGAVIGAGSVVTRDVDRYAVVAGNPARKLRDRFTPELVEAIETSHWWEIDLPELRRLVQERHDLVYHPTTAALAAWMDARRR